jgi:hypothetical protein
VSEPVNGAFRDSEKSQACWISDVLLKKSSCPLGPNKRFEADLLSYISHYGSYLKPLRERLAEYDFSHVKADLIGSVPGRHKSSANALRKWGYLRLGDLLKENVNVSKGCLEESTNVIQVFIYPVIQAYDQI